MEKKEIKYIAIESIDGYSEEDYINIKEVFSIIWSNKKKIISFTFIVTSLVIIYVLSLPNIYESKTILIPKYQEKSIPYSTSPLMSIVGVNISANDNKVSVSKLFRELLNDFSFNKKIIEKYHLKNRFSRKNMEKNMVFAFNFDIFYKIFSFFHKEFKQKNNEENEIYFIFQKIRKALEISTDKKSNLIIMKAKLPDRYLAKDLISIYLKEVSNYMKRVDFENIESQMRYYQNELSKVEDVELKENILNMISNLIKKKVLSLSGKYYMVKQLTEPKIAFIKEKVAPKRTLIVIVSFVSALVVSIFVILLLESIKSENIKKVKKCL